MADWAIIFDVDGVLLELIREEEELFFTPLASRCDASQLSRDWNSYRIRNDEDIVVEIAERYGLPHQDRINIKAEYLKLLEQQLRANQISSLKIPGAAELLVELAPLAKLGIATANFQSAAKLRLENAGLWHHISNHAFGADGGGHKHQILARVIASLDVPKSKIIFIGDNVNDVAAGLKNTVHFIGFSQDPKRLEILHNAGAIHLSNNHRQTRQIIYNLLSA